MQVREVMSKPVACMATDNAVRAAQIMENENTGIVPVVNDNSQCSLVGVVTDRDLCMDVIAKARNPKEVKVSECMTPEVVVCRPDDDIKDAARLMADNQIHRIAVVEDGKRLAGIVSMADLTWDEQLDRQTAGETVESISQPSPKPSKPRAKR
jgi:CBS domain-containing protein